MADKQINTMANFIAKDLYKILDSADTLRELLPKLYERLGRKVVVDALQNGSIKIYQEYFGRE